MAKQIVYTTFVLMTVVIVGLAMYAHHAGAQADGPQQPSADADVKEETVSRSEADMPSAVKEPPLIDFKNLGALIIEGVVFSIVGLIVLIVGYKVFDVATPYDLNRQIAEENNVAAGVAVAGVLISLGIIVAAAMGR